MNKNNFISNGYCIVRNAIPADLRDIITQYALFDEMQDFRSNDPQVPGAHSKYADPAMESILLYLQPLVEKETNLSLYPTYSFYRVYRNGDILYPHKDRPSCEVSVTVCFNYSYDDSKYNWPIIMGGDKINMYPGDIVIYRGIDIEHSRGEFTPPEDNWHVQAFLHYVDSNGPYKNYKFDGRESIGQLKINNIKKAYINYV